jgi:protein disulfide-isomerase
MKRMLMFLTLFAGSINCSEAADRINWFTNYDEAVKTSRNTTKPMVLLFTGSDWCTWCIKLEDEAFNSPDFANAVGDKFVFVKLDFPLNRSQPTEVTAQNKRLQKQFDVQGYPSVIILDSQQRKIANTGYRPGGGKQYATHLLQLLDGHASYQQKIDNLNKQAVAGIDLKILYEQATELKRENDIQTLVAAGLESEQKHFFLLERYRLLAEKGHIYSDEAMTIRKQLLESDPTNLKLTYYQVAIIDFEAVCQASGKEYPAEVAVASLVDYINKFGDQDKDNLWRLEMIISQVYFDRDKLPEALQYARSSYQVAPPEAQHEIAFTIKNIQSRLAAK